MHDGPVEAVLLRKNTVLPGHSQSVKGASAGTGTHEQAMTTQSVKFEGSRFSQHGHASTSIYACMCTSLPNEGCTRKIPPTLRCQAFYSPGACAK